MFSAWLIFSQQGAGANLREDDPSFVNLSSRWVFSFSLMPSEYLNEILHECLVHGMIHIDWKWVQANRIPTTPGSPSNRWLYKGWIARCHPTFTAASCSCRAEVRLEAGWDSGTRGWVATQYYPVSARTQNSAYLVPSQVLRPDHSYLLVRRPTVSTLNSRQLHTMP